MIYYPYEFMSDDFYRAAPVNSYIRLLNASPNSPSLDIYLDNKLIVQNLTYKEFSKYLPLPAGNYNIKVYSSGNKVNPIIDSPIDLPSGFAFNIAIIGSFPNITLYGIPEPTTPQNFGTACIRFIHLSPNAPAFHIRVQDGTKIFSNVKYEDYTTYACIPSGNYTFRLIPTGTTDVLLTIPNIQLMPNKYYSIYAVGLLGGSPPLQAFIVEEGLSIPK